MSPSMPHEASADGCGQLWSGRGQPHPLVDAVWSDSVGRG